MTYLYVQLDPRPTDEAKIKNSEVFSNAKVLGVEVTVPALAKQCSLGNIDPQHTDGNTGLAAIEVAMECDLPEAGSTLATIRCDLDSVGAMAVLELRSQREQVLSRIDLVAESDKFANGDWKKSELPTAENRWPDVNAQKLAAMSALVADFKLPLSQRVEAMKQWMLTGEESCEYRTQVEAERDALIQALADGSIKYSQNNGLAVVESSHRAAMMVGYSLAPVVVALNPEFGFGASPKVKKFTVAQYKAGYVDLQSVFAELSELESGWGGSPTIGGSPQGVSSQLTIKQVVAVVEKHLI